MLSENIEKYKNVLLIILSSLVILYFGKVLFIPLSFSILISFLLYPICARLENHKVSRMFAIAISIGLLVTFFLLLSALLFQQLSSFVHDWGSLKEKLPLALIQVNNFLNELGISADLQKKWFDYFSGNSSTELFRFFNSLLYSSGLILVWLVIIPFFSALILLNRSTLLKVLYSFFLPETVPTVHSVLHQIVKTFYNFIKGMIVVYIIVGILNSLGLLLLGIPHAFLFGFIVSVLTFIPYVGIIIGSLLPITVAWITYDSIWYPLGVVIVFSVVQYLEANLIFPLAVSSRLNISSLATLVSIIGGGILWGTAGMILFVPFIAIIKLIADNTKELHSLSLLLGNK